MRYRVKKDFVLNGTLLAWGDSLFLQQAQEKEQWEVYSLFSRKLIGTITTEQVSEYLNEDDNMPKERFKRSTGKTLRDITLLFLVLLPLWGTARQEIGKRLKPHYEIPLHNAGKNLVGIPIQWNTKLIQVTDNLFELHLMARMDTGYLIYLINDPDCKFSPKLSFSKSAQWEAVGGPDIYYSANKVKNWRCFPLPINICSSPVYLDSAIFVQTIRRIARNATIEARLDYYLLRIDTIGAKMGYEIKHSTHPKIDSILQSVTTTPKLIEKLPENTYSYRTYCANVSPKNKRKFFGKVWWRIKHPFL